MTSKRTFLSSCSYLKLNLYSEERTSSTHALTMYRHNTVHNGKEYKVGKHYR